MSLTRDAVLAAAVEILDTYGLADLSMRRLGEALGVKQGAIYWHVPNKQTLLAGVADMILGDVPAPGDGPWQPGIRRWACDVRAILLRHPDSAQVVASARAVGLSTSPVTAAAAGLLAAHGLPAAAAHDAALALLRYTLGHVNEEQEQDAAIRLKVRDTAPDAAERNRSFDAGLQLLLDGLERAMPTATSAGAAPGPTSGRS